MASILTGELLLILQNPTQIPLLVMICLSHGELCFYSIPFSSFHHSGMALTTLEVLCFLPLDWVLCSADIRACPPLYILSTWHVVDTQFLAYE